VAREHDQRSVAATHRDATHEAGGFEAANVVICDALAASNDELQRLGR
jgi:hypothetical protein